MTNSTLIKLFVALALVIAVVVAILNHLKSFVPETVAETPMVADAVDLSATQNPTPGAVRPTPNPEAGGLERPAFPREQVEAWLKQQGRDAASLLAAFRAMADTNYLNEAATNFPDDPKVQWTVLARNAFPAERRKWLDAFKRSSPDNSVGFYLSADDYFRSGNTDAAAREFEAADDKNDFDNHENESREDSEDLYGFFGKTKLEAAGLSMTGISADLTPMMSAFKQVGQDIAALQKKAVDAGDLDAAGDIYDQGTTLVDNLQNGDGGDYLISHLVGIADQSLLLSGLNQNTTYEFLDDQTPVQVMQELNEQKSVITQVIKSFNGIYASLTPKEMLDYAEQVKDDGELAAMQSVLEQHSQAPAY